MRVCASFRKDYDLVILRRVKVRPPSTPARKGKVCAMKREKKRERGRERERERKRERGAQIMKGTVLTRVVIVLGYVGGLRGRDVLLQQTESHR